MAEPFNVVDLKIWPKQFIDFLFEEAVKGNTPYGKMKTDYWPFVTDQFNNQSGKSYNLSQIKEKFKQLKKRYGAFSHLMGRIDMKYDPVTNIITGSDAAWLDAVKVNSKCIDFCKKGLDHYELLGQLFHMVAQTFSAQYISADDVDEQGSNPKGKQLAYFDTSTGKKMKAGSLDRATESRKIVESAQVPNPFSMAKATEILLSITMFKALENLEKLECRQVFITLTPEKRRGWIEYLSSLQ